MFVHGVLISFIDIVNIAFNYIVCTSSVAGHRVEKVLKLSYM